MWIEQLEKLVEMLKSRTGSELLKKAISKYEIAKAREDSHRGMIQKLLEGNKISHQTAEVMIKECDEKDFSLSEAEIQRAKIVLTKIKKEEGAIEESNQKVAELKELEAYLSNYEHPESLLENK